MLIWPRSKPKNDAHDAQRLNQSRQIQDQEPWRRRPEDQETRRISEKSDVTEKTSVKGGAVVMIGPIPIVMGSDPRIALVMMIIALTIMILWALAVKGSYG